MLVADGRLEEADGALPPTGDLGDAGRPGDAALADRRRASTPSTRRRSALPAGRAPCLARASASVAWPPSSGVDAADLEARLRGLVRRELLVFEADPRVARARPVLLHPVLIAEVAYGTLARRERRTRHLAAARYFESSGGDELAAVLASHYLSAYEASAQGPKRKRSAPRRGVALRAAAERAAALGGHKQAAAMLEQALSVTSDAGERARLQEQRAIELYYAGRYDDANVAIHEAVETYRALGDIASRTRAQAWLGPILIHAGHLELAASELQSALNELPPDADPAARAELLAKLARVEYRLDHNERAIDVANQALAIAEHHRFVRTVADAMTSKGTALASLGRTFEAMNLMRGGMELAKREGDFDTAMRAGNNLGGGRLQRRRGTSGPRPRA